MEDTSKIPYENLPTKVQAEIERILYHRKRIRAFTKKMIPLAIAGNIINVSINQRHGKDALPVIATTTAFYTGLGLLALKEHGRQYTLEETRLWRALQQSKDPSVCALWKKYPFLAVDAKGGLVGKKMAPKIWFVPIGRRRIQTRKKPVHAKSKPNLKVFSR